MIERAIGLTADDAFAPGDRSTATAMAVITLVTLAAWTAFASTPVKYIIYSLPFTLAAAYLVCHGGQARIALRGVAALGLFLPLAAGTIIINSWYDFHAIRDIAIIGGYLLLFTLWLEAPAATARLALAALITGLLVEGATEGFSGSFNLLGSEGILESTLAFPLGVVTIYFVRMRQWTLAAVAAVALFLAFKRIAFAAVAAAVLFDVATGIVSQRTARRLAFLAVLALSLMALFSTQLFELASSTLNLERSSADAISLGRYNIAIQVWGDMGLRPLRQWVIGSGPGSADAFVTANSHLINLHNDWLKILYDYGLLGFLVIHAVLYIYQTESRTGVALYLYSAIVMMTDNIFIYMFYHPFVFLMICTARGTDPEGQDGETP